MAKRQTRRSISVKGTTYARIANALVSGAVEGSVSAYVEELIDSDMRARGVAPVEKAPPREAKPKQDDPDGKVASGMLRANREAAGQ